MLGLLSARPWLLDGELVASELAAFADTKTKLFHSAAFGSGKLDTLGTRVETIKPDAAPGEYTFPGWVARLRGDTVALIDFSALRTTLWTRQGKPLSVLAIVPVFAVTAKVTDPDPVRPVPPGNVRKRLALVAPQAHPGCVVTVIVPFAAGSNTLIAAGLIE